MKAPRVSLFVMLLAVGALAGACKRQQPPSGGSAAAPATLASSACAHAACGDGYFVDAVPVGSCAVGESCALSLRLVATGDYHINDEYPYKFRAEDAAGVDFQGKNADDKSVFSKAAGDWSKTDERAGRMSVAFMPRDPADKRVAGVFKLSVCSAQSCRLEQPRLEARVPVR
jgi:hypothetical protein